MIRSSNSLLLAHLEGNRIAHTYLFTGAAGAEKSALALEFAKALNCEKRNFLQECACASCRKIEHRNHPDVQWFEGDKKTGSIRIEEVRSKLYQASLTPYEGKWKVFIIEQAENLTLESSNALLKTLEEPPGHCVFLLLVENKAHLLETIQSRAFEIRTAPVPEKDPRQDEKIRLLEAKGWDAFFEGLRGDSRQELVEDLGTLLFYLRDSSVVAWKKSPGQSKKYLEAAHSVYETQEALDANANQKLALTHLEIRLGKILNG